MTDEGQMQFHHAQQVRDALSGFPSGLQNRDTSR